MNAVRWSRVLQGSTMEFIPDQRKRICSFFLKFLTCKVCVSVNTQCAKENEHVLVAMYAGFLFNFVLFSWIVLAIPLKPHLKMKNTQGCCFLLLCLSLVTGTHRTDWEDPEEGPFCFWHCLWFIRIHSAAHRDLLRVPCEVLLIKSPLASAAFGGDTLGSFRHRPFSLASDSVLYLKNCLLLFPGNKAVVCRLFAPSLLTTYSLH